MTDTIHGDVRPFLRTIDAATPEQVVKTAQAAAAHIDAQDAKIKALVEALGRLCFELGALEAFGEEVRHEIGNTNYTAIMTRYEAARAALAAAKEAT